MKRRKFIRLVQTGVLAGFSTIGIERSLLAVAQTPSSSNGLTVRWLGHTCYFFSGGGLRVLINPFRQIGCTAGYRNPKVDTDLVLISSRLLDEGSIDGFSGNPALLYEPGVYQFNGAQVQGIRTIKDRQQGRRFGTNVAWMWKQGGIKILHLGGLAGPIDIEERILIGRPDVMFVPVGGGPKSYTPEEAKQTIQTLNPRVVIPMHYKTLAADPATCDLVPLENFLEVMGETPVQRVASDTVTFQPGNLPSEGSVIEVLSYQFGNGSPGNPVL
ncbi:MBL fold metallo-hydrolase [Limnoraphis robusta]|uniref:Zn-dependent hydrolase n=2 Tax=Limnoraphis robusta TaxID=1118279 RepID=A0A0F5YL53_9CYAN|nr:MBL fold metallo-hydrolase [Limnoraphis robusta]KKD39629.1 Zn-dependent hydrolase [Limnoraphis robusta CS-951]MEA5520086.1 MBL fold metallo-hydrolase [Limnoraphis robusta CCNP1315]MEA5546782.1 MBL fold metallo-hydrolase [Limnoraphis robusta CCNP1324]